MSPNTNSLMRKSAVLESCVLRPLGDPTGLGWACNRCWADLGPSRPEPSPESLWRGSACTWGQAGSYEVHVPLRYVYLTPAEGLSCTDTGRQATAIHRGMPASSLASRHIT